jgi:hypothetical protein
MRLQSLAIISVGAALSLSAPSPAAAQSSRYDETVSAAALKWEIAFLGLSAVDAAQTIYCLERNKCEEANPLFGKHPSTKTIVLAKLISGGVHFALFNEIRKKDPKMALRIAQISFALQGTVVALNARIVF